MRSYTYTREVDAQCHDCGKRWQSKNAQGVAARHHDATGHKVGVEVVMYIIYGGKPDEAKTKREQPNAE